MVLINCTEKRLQMLNIGIKKAIRQTYTWLNQIKLTRICKVSGNWNQLGNWLQLRGTIIACVVAKNSFSDQFTLAN